MTSSARDPIDDATLQAAANGDARAWRKIVERLHGRVYALVFRQAGDRDLADEITQHAFVRAFEAIGRYQETGRFEAWLFRIAMNRLRDEMRRRKRQAQPMDMSGSGRAGDDQAWPQVEARLAEREHDHTATPLGRLTHAEDLQALRDAVASLGEAERELLYLRHTAGLTFAQIAEALEQPLGTVLARGHRALGKLKTMLEPQAG